MQYPLNVFPLKNMFIIIFFHYEALVYTNARPMASQATNCIQLFCIHCIIFPISLVCIISDPCAHYHDYWHFALSYSFFKVKLIGNLLMFQIFLFCFNELSCQLDIIYMEDTIKHINSTDIKCR